MPFGNQLCTYEDSDEVTLPKTRCEALGLEERLNLLGNHIFKSQFQGSLYCFWAYECLRQPR